MCHNDMRGNLTRHTAGGGETELLYYADSLPAGVTACYNGNLSACIIDLLDANRLTTACYSPPKHVKYT